MYHESISNKLGLGLYTPTPAPRWYIQCQLGYWALDLSLYNSMEPENLTSVNELPLLNHHSDRNRTKPEKLSVLLSTLEVSHIKCKLL